MENIFIIQVPDDRPIKMVYESDFEFIENDDYEIEFIRKLSPTEVDKLLLDIFKTTKVGYYKL